MDMPSKSPWASSYSGHEAKFSSDLMTQTILIVQLHGVHRIEFFEPL